MLWAAGNVFASRRRKGVSYWRQGQGARHTRTHTHTRARERERDGETAKRRRYISSTVSVVTIVPPVDRPPAYQLIRSWTVAEGFTGVGTWYFPSCFSPSRICVLRGRLSRAQGRLSEAEEGATFFLPGLHCWGCASAL